MGAIKNPTLSKCHDEYRKYLTTKHMVSSRHLTPMPLMHVRCREARVCVPRCVTTLASIVLISMNGVDATCMVSGFTLVTWHRKATGISPSREPANLDDPHIA